MKTGTGKVELLKKWTEEIAAFREELADIAVKDYPLADVVGAQADTAALLQAAKEFQTEVQKMFDLLRRHKVPEALEAAGMEKATIKGVGTVYLASDIRTKIKDNEVLIDALEAAGMGDLVRQTVHPSTLKATIKEMLLDGEDIDKLLNGAIEVDAFTEARIRKN